MVYTRAQKKTTVQNQFGGVSALNYKLIKEILRFTKVYCLIDRTMYREIKDFLIETNSTLFNIMRDCDTLGVNEMERICDIASTFKIRMLYLPDCFLIDWIQMKCSFLLLKTRVWEKQKKTCHSTVSKRLLCIHQPFESKKMSSDCRACERGFTFKEESVFNNALNGQYTRDWDELKSTNDCKRKAEIALKLKTDFVTFHALTPDKL
jgi:hypothetical protein